MTRQLSVTDEPSWQTTGKSSFGLYVVWCQQRRRNSRDLEISQEPVSHHPCLFAASCTYGSASPTSYLDITLMKWFATWTIEGVEIQPGSALLSGPVLKHSMESYLKNCSLSVWGGTGPNWWDLRQINSWSELPVFNQSSTCQWQAQLIRNDGLLAWTNAHLRLNSFSNEGRNNHICLGFQIFHSSSSCLSNLKEMLMSCFRAETSTWKTTCWFQSASYGWV